MDTPIKFKNIDEYIASFPDEDVRQRMQTIRQIVHKEAPEAEEVIKYHMPTFVFHGNLVYFAGFKHHISMFPSTAGMEVALEELKPHLAGRGTIQFRLDQPLPEELVRKIVQWRVKEVLEGATY